MSDYEKKYKEALEVAKRKLCFDKAGMVDSFTPNDIYEMFPELKESEDERIREVLIDYFKRYKEEECGIKTFYGIPADDILAWLEKQKEFVSADFDDVWKTADCDELTAPLEKYSKDAIKKMCHAWYDKGIELERRNWLEKQGTQPRYNIGDILCDNLCTTLNKDAQPNMEIVDIKNGMYICDKGSFPVSQQDEYVLVGKKIDSKLNDDSVSNELRAASFAHAKKEILNHTFPNNEEFELIYTFEEGAKWNAAQKSTWSKEDEYRAEKLLGWLNTLINYIQGDATVSLDLYRERKRQVEIIKTWLKSLKALNTWKPSDKQIKALKNFTRSVGESGYFSPYDDNTKLLYSLLEDLKKLK